jgi:hypothetical protein
LEGSTVKWEEKDIVQEIQRRNRERDAVPAAVMELIRGHQRSIRGEEWKEQNGLILF